jgi:hypothetical protein
MTKRELFPNRRYPESIGLLKALPGLDLSDGMIHVPAASAPELSQKLEAIQSLVERISWGDLFSELARRHPEFQSEANDLSDQQWAAGRPDALEEAVRLERPHGRRRTPSRNSVAHSTRRHMLHWPRCIRIAR